MNLLEVSFNGHKSDDYIPGKPSHNARQAKTAIARMQRHALEEQAWRRACLDDVLAGVVRDAVASFKAGRSC